jgi:hypothetical protein
MGFTDLLSAFPWVTCRASSPPETVRLPGTGWAVALKGFGLPEVGQSARLTSTANPAGLADLAPVHFVERGDDPLLVGSG